MMTTLDRESVAAVFEQIKGGGSAARSKFAHLVQPMHVVYGGADLFSSGTVAKLGTIAKKSLAAYAPAPADLTHIFGLEATDAERVYRLVASRLDSRPVDDYRVDFEDGYGIRSDTDEDGHALAAARETATAMAEGLISPYFGIRPKAFSPECFRRSVRTLDIYLTALIDAVGRVPANFVVTLPKVASAAQVSALAELLDVLEEKLGLANESIAVEVMVETPEAIIATDGSIALPGIAAAARGRCRGAHFGAYDYTAALGITSSSQTLGHQASDLARNIMQASLASSSIWLSDGATNVMPTPIHRGSELTAAQVEANLASVHAGWRLHFDNCRRSLDNGFYQGWDLHPNQLVARFVAVYSFFIKNIDEMAVRLAGFVERTSRASMAGSTFDDAATGQGLLNFFRRAMDCEAVNDEESAALTGLEPDEIRQGSFIEIVAKRTR